MGNSGSSLQTCLNSVCNGRASCVRYPSDPLYQLAWVKPVSSRFWPLARCRRHRGLILVKYNLDIGVTPVAVIRPQTAADISAIVKCATSNNVKIQAKSGGHSYAYVLRPCFITDTLLTYSVRNYGKLLLLVPQSSTPGMPAD